MLGTDLFSCTRGFLTPLMSSEGVSVNLSIALGVPHGFIMFEVLCRTALHGELHIH